MASSSGHDATTRSEEATIAEPQPLVQPKEEPEDLADMVEPMVIVQLNKYWVTMTTSETNLETLRGRGLLLEGYVWTATQGENHPTPGTFQITTFTAHCECGFGV